MSAEQIIAEIERLPAAEQEQVYSAVAVRRANKTGANPSALDSHARRMGFDEAKELIFRENKEAYQRLAQ